MLSLLEVEFAWMNSRGQEQDSTEGRSCPQLILILISLFLLLTAMILGVIGVMSPSWQIVDIREFQAEHHVSYET